MNKLILLYTFIISYCLCFDTFTSPISGDTWYYENDYYVTWIDTSSNFTLNLYLYNASHLLVDSLNEIPIPDYYNEFLFTVKSKYPSGIQYYFKAFIVEDPHLEYQSPEFHIDWKSSVIPNAFQIVVIVLVALGVIVTVTCLYSLYRSSRKKQVISLNDPYYQPLVHTGYVSPNVYGT